MTMSMTRPSKAGEDAEAPGVDAAFGLDDEHDIEVALAGEHGGARAGVRRLVPPGVRLARAFDHGVEGAPGGGQAACPLRVRDGLDAEDADRPADDAAFAGRDAGETRGQLGGIVLEEAIDDAVQELVAGAILGRRRRLSRLTA
jgi:hypothetical protein